MEVSLHAESALKTRDSLVKVSHLKDSLKADNIQKEEADSKFAQSESDKIQWI